MWTDSHCHLPEDGVVEVVDEARAAGVERLVTVGTHRGDWGAALGAAAGHDGVWATAGVHPHHAADGLDGLGAALGAPGVVAVGECGLDYHHDRSPRDQQREVFAAQVALAHRNHLALVIHTREAWDDTFAILAAEGTPARTVFHCFTGGPREAARALDTGAVLSFSGIVTFTGATEVRAAAARCPLDRLTVETDAPFLAPVPKRGRPNRPAWVPLVGAAVAAVKGVAVEAVAEASTTTAAEVFGLG
ncbi:MAG: TatD family hydrolase [Acidimicrobiales bacterium]